MRPSRFFKKLYYRTTGYSYTNLGRLFLRLFVGVMMMQFGLRQLNHYSEICDIFPAVLGMSPAATLTVMICIEIGCSLFIMAGFLTRLMTLAPFVAMLIAEHYILNTVIPQAAYTLDWSQQGYLPVMFMGIYFFILLVGPGKISVDYFMSLHIIHSDNSSEAELEEV